MTSPAAAALAVAHAHALKYLESLPERPVRAETDPKRLRVALGDVLSEDGAAAEAVIERLGAAGELGVMPSTGGRFFSFVMGGTHPAGMGADWLTSAWDQNCGLYALAPLNSVAEDIAAEWALDLLGLPGESAVGFCTGATMANFTCLAAARHALLARVGWDVEADGLYGAPEIAVLIGADAHSSVDHALRYLGFGSARVTQIAADDQGRMRADDLAAKLAELHGRLVLVCAQAGQINTGACDPFEAIVAACRAHDAWLHVDGAFGLWAQAAPETRHLTAGIEGAQSWAVDAHKWLNTPYDGGLAIVRDASALKGAMAIAASYLKTGDGVREPYHYVPELSRRARGFAIWATLAALGRGGVRELVVRFSALARRMRDALAGEAGVHCLNDVVLNQAIFRFEAASGEAADGDVLTQAVADAVTESGEAYLFTAQWRGRTVMRVSVCSQMTRGGDIDRAARAVLKAYRELRGG